MAVASEPPASSGFFNGRNETHLLVEVMTTHVFAGHMNSQEMPRTAGTLVFAEGGGAKER